MSNTTTIPGKHEYFEAEIIPLSELNYSRGNPQPDFMPVAMMRKNEIAFAPPYLFTENEDGGHSLFITGYVSKERVSPADVMVKKTAEGFMVLFPVISYPQSGQDKVPVEVLTP